MWKAEMTRPRKKGEEPKQKGSQQEDALRGAPWVTAGFLTSLVILAH